MKKLFVVLIILVVLISGCTTSGIQTLKFSGESENWSGTVTINYNPVEKHYSKNTVIRPKNKIDMDFIKYTTTFNSDIFGISSDQLEGEEIANKNSFGVNGFSGGNTDLTWETIKDEIKYAKVEIEWRKDGIKNNEVIFMDNN